jgi:hypothetical protein
MRKRRKRCKESNVESESKSDFKRNARIAMRKGHEKCCTKIDSRKALLKALQKAKLAYAFARKCKHSYLKKVSDLRVLVEELLGVVQVHVGVLHLPQLACHGRTCRKMS